jgi:putative transcriptional regulator
MMGAWGEGIGKERTKAGDWLSRHSVTQGDLSKWSGLARNTISRISSDPTYRASSLTKRTIVAALTTKGYSIDEYDLW